MSLAPPILLAAALLLAPIAAPAGANGDFAGDWVFDAKRSKNTDLREATQRVTLEGDDVRVQRTVTRGNLDPEQFEFVYLTNGNPHKVVGQFEREVTAVWDGKELRVEWTFDVRGFEVAAQEIWKKKRAGLEIKYKFKAGGTENTSKLFFVRPPEPAAEVGGGGSK